MKIKIIGITGGIASGKTTVVNEIRKNGYQVIDADQVVHDLKKRWETLQGIARMFWYRDSGKRWGAKSTSSVKTYIFKSSKYDIV